MKDLELKNNTDNLKEQQYEKINDQIKYFNKPWKQIFDLLMEYDSLTGHLNIG